KKPALRVMPHGPGLDGGSVPGGPIAHRGPEAAEPLRGTRPSDTSVVISDRHEAPTGEIARKRLVVALLHSGGRVEDDDPALGRCLGLRPLENACLDGETIAGA